MISSNDMRLKASTRPRLSSGGNTPVADGVQLALGRPARDFSDYVRRTAAMGVWANEG
jgi:hypothetical protein